MNTAHISSLGPPQLLTPPVAPPGTAWTAVRRHGSRSSHADPNAGATPTLVRRDASSPMGTAPCRKDLDWASGPQVVTMCLGRGQSGKAQEPRKAGSTREACEQAAGTATAVSGGLSPIQGAIGPQLYKDPDPGQVTMTRSPPHPPSIL